MAEQTKFSKFAERLLVGVLESGARALAKGAESLASDASKALKREVAKVEALERGVKTWRESRLGEIDGDVPEELRDETTSGATNGAATHHT